MVLRLPCQFELETDLEIRGWFISSAGMQECAGQSEIATSLADSMSSAGDPDFIACYLQLDISNEDRIVMCLYFLEVFVLVCSLGRLRSRVHFRLCRFRGGS